MRPESQGYADYLENLRPVALYLAVFRIYKHKAGNSMDIQSFSTSMNIELELKSQMHIWGLTKQGTDIRQTHRFVYRVTPQLKA